ncbi:serine/threonine-protein kinase Pink1, mitochondrial [Hyalella azteca]|uniref:non-specific serine/threonine protein kinase n=1 Tax=Hyalella azteca TaxID=294128 RepID=A0A8B7MXT1_HYAAZ|nr:serine/threonine-protein kinase Pink1, mitochondrial [Hyalella azteca]
MILSLRNLAWRALQCAKFVLRDQGILANARAAPFGCLNGGKSILQKYLLQHQSATLQKTISGPRRGNQAGKTLPRESNVSGVLISQRPLANLLGRVGPLLSGAIWRLSTQRSSLGTPVFIKDSAPLFALVGVTLVASSDDSNPDKQDVDLKKRGFVTREEELETICGSIRNAISKSGWLESLQCDLPVKKQKAAASSSDIAASSQSYSLQDLDIAGVIDKGCNAAVYAARWKTDDKIDEPYNCSSTSSVSPSNDLPHTSQHQTSHSPARSSNVNIPFSQMSEGFFRSSPFYYSTLNLNSSSPLEETIARTVSVEALYHPLSAQFNEEHDSLLHNISAEKASSPQSQHQRNDQPLTASSLSISGQFGSPSTVRPKRVTFNVPSNLNSNSGYGQTSTNNNVSEEGRPTAPISQFPLAVKLVFNYEAASNAPAILSALYRELLPARSVQLNAPSDTMLEVLQAVVPYHPNLVDMPCAFVDRVPLLDGGLQLYPNALPARLSPHGLGRNMSLFCVMRRYEMTLAQYLELNPHPSCRTALLLLAQLLEALQHLHRHHIAHRDLKPDNILMLLTDGVEAPWLVITDFGCSLAASSASGLRVPFVSREAEPRQGNAALMAPEVKSARPGMLQSVDFSKSDLWAAGTLAYQFFGLPNPFLSGKKGCPQLDSVTYKESELPDLRDTDAPAPVRRLVADLLARKPANRPSASVAATLSQLCLWGPSSWLQPSVGARPQREQVMEWLLTLTAKVLFERSGVSAATEYRLVSAFLARVRFTDVLKAISWNKAY